MAIGQKIAELRKQHNLTQEQLAEKLGVTGQAVSKWENSITSPDISLLPCIAAIFNTCTDDLLGVLSDEKQRQLNYITEKVKKNLLLKIEICSEGGDAVNIKIPYLVLKNSFEAGLKIPSVNNKLKDIDFNLIFDAVEQGLSGEIINIKSNDGDTVKVIIEIS